MRFFCLFFLSHIVAVTYSAEVPIAIAAEVGQTVRLSAGESALFPDIDASLRLIGFVYHTCPEGAQCARGPFSTVQTELTRHGIVYPHDSEVGSSVQATGLGRYGVAIRSSDHTTYAELLVFEHEKVCRLPGETGHLAGDECWRALAKRTGETVYCRQPHEKNAQDHCMEEVAAAFSYPRLCERIKSPTDYCLWRRAVETHDASLCPRFLKTHFSTIDACYRYLGFLDKGETAICNVLQNKERARCVAAIKEQSASPDPNANAPYHVLVLTEGSATLQGGIMVEGVYWKCYRDQCMGSMIRTSSPEHVCRGLAAKIGSFVGFEFAKRQLSDAELRRCNAVKEQP